MDDNRISPEDSNRIAAEDGNRISAVDSNRISAVDSNRIWTKEYIMLLAANFFVSFNFYSLMVTSASFAISELGVAEAKAGFGTGIFVIGALISRIVVSRFITPHSFKPTVIVGIGALVVLTALLFAAGNFTFFCIVRFLGGATFGVNSNTLTTMVSYNLPANSKGEGLSWFSMGQILGMAIGPFFSVYIMHRYGFDEVFLLSTLVAVAAFIVVAVVKQPGGAKPGGAKLDGAKLDGAKLDGAKQPGGAKQPDGARLPAPQTGSSQGAAAHMPEEMGVWRFFERDALKFTFLCIILYICFSNYMSFAAVFASLSGAENLSSGIFLASAGAMLAARPVVGKVFDRYGPNALLVFGFLVFSSGFFLLSRGLVSAFLLSAIFLGLGISALQGTTLFIVVSNAPKHRLAVANATYYFGLDVGGSIGPAIGGGIAEASGYGTMYIVCAAVAIACLPLYFGLSARGGKSSGKTGT